MQLREMDEQTTYRQQLEQDNGPVVLINQFTVAPEDAQHFLEVWADDAAFMKQQPGFVSTQLHRGTAGSMTFINLAVWESAAALGAAFRDRTWHWMPDYVRVRGQDRSSAPSATAVIVST